MSGGRKWPTARRSAASPRPAGGSCGRRAAAGQYGDVEIEVEPAPGKGFVFENKIVGGSVPREYIPAVEKGIREALESGVLAGYPVVDIQVSLMDGSYHDVDSSEMAFKIAGSMAFKDAVKRRRAPCSSSRSCRSRW